MGLKEELINEFFLRKPEFAGIVLNDFDVIESLREEEVCLKQSAVAILKRLTSKKPFLEVNIHHRLSLLNVR